MPIYAGSCHCGRVTFEFDGDVTAAIECNCSICHMKGAIWYNVDAARFRLLSGETGLGSYQFGTMTATHYFCKTCGVSPFSHPRIAPAMWVVNLRCVEGVDLARLTIHAFDGQHWETAARELLQAHKAGTAS